MSHRDSVDRFSRTDVQAPLQMHAVYAEVVQLHLTKRAHVTRTVGGIWLAPAECHGEGRQELTSSPDSLTTSVVFRACLDCKM